MKTMDFNDRTTLESEILRAACTRTDWFGLFDLTALDFRNKHTRKIYKFLVKLIEENKEVSLAAFANDFKVEEVRHLFSGEYQIISAKQYTEACSALREDTIRLEIMKKIEECGDSYEYFEFIEAAKKLNTVGDFAGFEEVLKNYADAYKAIQNKENGGAVYCSWPQFSKKAPLFPGDYAVLGARTSIGKTSFALSYAIDAAILGQKVLFFSAEMSEKHILDKVAAILMQEPVYKFKFAHKPFVHVEQALQTIKDNFNVVYLPSLSTSTISGMLRKSGRVDLVVVDYLQLLKDYPRKSDTENLRLGRISGKLKQMAGEFKTVMFVAAQLNRDSEKQKREPVLSDLRDSGCIEQDADVVFLLHREDRESTSADMIIAKNRTGEVGRIGFLFNPECSYFRESDDAH